MSVYFVTCREVNAVKIGSSIEPHARLGEIQWGCPLLLKLEAILPGGCEEEFRLHRWFEDDRIRGEWFALTLMIESIIAANPAPEYPDHDATARAQAKKLGIDPSKRGFVAALAEVRVMEALPKPTPRFNSKLLSRDHRKRVAAGDIYFPFRGKTYA